jgi:truncated hemoglobin YjbI
VGVHGDMTVMNKDEMAKLNQVFKGSLVTGEERLHQRKKKRRKRTVSDEKPNWVESFRNCLKSVLKFKNNK